MAGHPQENSWQHGSQGEPDYGPVYEQPGVYGQPSEGYEQQPSGQEETLYEHPVSYEQPSYSEQPGYGEQPGYAEHGRYDQRERYGQPGQGRYDRQGQGRYDQQGKGRPKPGWEKLPRQQAGKSASGSSGFMASLFDFGFASFVTPKIIKALYALITAWTLLCAIYLLFVGNHLGHIAGLLFVLVIVDPIFILLSLGLVRVMLEFFMVTFRMQEDLKALREQAAGTTAKAGGDEGPGASGPGNT